ncbi:MAG: hypothetical protein HKP40_01675, partial [Litoreibacter sp.]|nr:hypothetical protein [Litoreibacter sp.]
TSHTVYDNPSTDVKFVWEFGDEVIGSQPETSPAHGTKATLSVDYMNPTFFAREAAIEVDALMRAFDLKIYDPQEQQVMETPFDADTFEANYAKHATEMAASLLETAKPKDIPLNCPRDVLETVWDWNYWRDDLRLGLEEDLFVPTIQFARHDGALLTAVVWGDGVPALLPKAEVILIAHLDIAPETGLMRRRKPFYELVPYEEFAHDFRGFFTLDPELGEGLVCPNDQRAEVLEYLLQRKPGIVMNFDAPARKRIITTHSPGQVLDSELLGAIVRPG